MSQAADFATLDLDDLRRVALAATPGPWEAMVSDSGLSYREFNASVITERLGDRVADVDYNHDAEGPHADEGNDAYYIAAFDPPTVLALISEVERLKPLVDGWRATAQAYADGLDKTLDSIEYLQEPIPVADPRTEHSSDCLQATCRPYLCPTSGDAECAQHGGFTTCCADPACPSNSTVTDTMQASVAAAAALVPPVQEYVEVPTLRGLVRMAALTVMDEVDESDKALAYAIAATAALGLRDYVTGLLTQARANAWPCTNYAAPHTCLTAPSSPAERCRFCHEQTFALYNAALDNSGAPSQRNEPTPKTPSTTLKASHA